MLTPIVKRALTDTVTDIGQLSQGERRELQRAVTNGVLSKGRGGPFPILKTVYAVKGFDFEADRRESIEGMVELARKDKETLGW